MFGNITLKDTSGIVNFGDLQGTVAEVGEAVVYEEIRRGLDAHNAIVQSLYTEFCERTEEYQGVYGNTGPKLKVKRGNETSNPDVQKLNLKPVTVGFPLDKTDIAVGWTRHAFRTMTVESMRLQFEAVLGADVDDFYNTLMKAIFNPLNDEDYIDYLVDGKEFPVLAFLNGDGRHIPAAPGTNTTFASNHTHYRYSTTLDEDTVRDTITNVTEHGRTGEVRLYINPQQKTAIVNMRNSGAFAPFQMQGVVYPQVVVQSGAGGTPTYAQGVYAAGGTYDPFETEQEIGYFEGIRVFVRTWVPANYILAIDTGRADVKPLAYRVRPGGIDSELGLRYEHEHFPMRAEVMTREYGISAKHRHMVAITYINAGATAYVVPAFAV